MALKRKGHAPYLLEKVRIGPFEMDRLDWIMSGCVGAILVALLIFRFACAPVITRGVSMEPTIHNGEVYLTNPHFSDSDLTHGAVVVFTDRRGMTLIKRIEGIPGDRIVIRGGVLCRNGQPVEEGLPAMEDAGPYGKETEIGMEVYGDIEEKTYFVLGDNRNHSSDSRDFGVVPRHAIRAVITAKKPLFTIPPFFLGDAFF